MIGFQGFRAMETLWPAPTLRASSVPATVKYVPAAFKIKSALPGERPMCLECALVGEPFTCFLNACQAEAPLQKFYSPNLYFSSGRYVTFHLSGAPSMRLTMTANYPDGNLRDNDGASYMSVAKWRG